MAPQMITNQQRTPPLFESFSSTVLQVFHALPSGGNTYEPDTFPLLSYFDIFKRAAPEFQRRCADSSCCFFDDHAAASAASSAMTEEFFREVDALEARVALDPKATEKNVALPHLDVEEPIANTRRLCRLRQEIMAKHGFFDVFTQVKGEENEKALNILPTVLQELDDVKEKESEIAPCFRGVLAGNLFDLGSADTAAAFSRGESGFESAKQRLKPRPWLLDDVDTLVDALGQSQSSPRYDKAILFVDNAGADVLLGMVPLARALLRAGVREVVMAANEIYAINDVTFEELKELMPRAANADPSGDLARALADGRWRAVSSGSDLPVIDLRGVSAELNEEASSVALDRLFVVLEGMGRGIETNLNQPLLCDSMRIGMVKHPEVATHLGGSMYDCVCKFLPRVTT